MEPQRHFRISTAEKSPPSLPAGRKYQPLVIGLFLSLCVGMQACSPKEQLQVSYGEWEMLEPGTPPSDSPEQPLVGRTIAEGAGPSVELGDLVEMHFRTTAAGNGGRKAGEYDEGRGWYWIAFDGPAKTEFPVGANLFAGALIGLHLGSTHTFVDNPRSHGKGTYAGVHNMPFGVPQRFYDNKPLARPSDGGYAYFDRGPGNDVTRIEITHICKGLATQRLITLTDNTTISISQDMFRSHDANAPRWMFLREAMWEGKCNDGKHASFNYGPIIVEPPAGMGKGLNISTLWGPWIKKAWDKVPVGVVLK